MPAFDLDRIRETYLGGQSPQEFLENGGDPHEYARLVFAGQIFGDDDPAAPEIGIETEDDLAEALVTILGLGKRLRALDEHREATQFPRAREGHVSRSHNINASPATHERFARLTPQERGDLIDRALQE